MNSVPPPQASGSTDRRELLPVATKGAYLGLAFLTGLNLFNYLDRNVLASVLDPIQTDIGLNNAEGGQLASAFMIGYFLTAPVFGYLGDRSPRKWLIAIGVFFWSVGTILTGFCHSYWPLIACRVLVGLGEASYATLAPSWISDLFSPARRNNAFTIFYVAIPVGSALGYEAGSIALNHGGWRGGFLWAGAPGLLLALLLLALREPKRGAADVTEEGAPPVGKPTIRDIGSLFAIPNYLLIVLGYTAYTFALGAFAVWAPKFLHRTHDMDLSRANFLFGLILAVTGLISTMVGGLIATAWQRRTPAGYAWLSTVSVVLAIPVAYAAFLVGSAGSAITCLAAAMFFLFLSTGPINTLTVESVPIALRSSAMAVSIFTIHLLGDLLSPTAVGYLADLGAQPGQPDAGLPRALLLLPTVLIVGAALWAWLAWRQRQAPNPSAARTSAQPA